MNHSQEVDRRVYEGQVYAYRSTLASDAEARYKAQVSRRTKYAFELLTEASDELEKLHAILDAKTYTTPSMAYHAQRLRAVGGLIAETLPLRYALG